MNLVLLAGLLAVQALIVALAVKYFGERIGPSVLAYSALIWMVAFLASVYIKLLNVTEFTLAEITPEMYSIATTVALCIASSAIWWYAGVKTDDNRRKVKTS